MLKSFKIYNKAINSLSDSDKLLITTINAHCYNIAQTDVVYKDAILNSDVLIPDGVSVAWAIKWLTGQKIRKIAGADLFFYEMDRLEQTGGKCFFLGSTDTTLQKIEERVKREYPNITVKSYSPPYKQEFSAGENRNMLNAINAFQPDVLFVGMTAPKQEKWAYTHFNNLQVGHICCIGAVFDFYAGTVNRAPQWMINFGLEWFYRLIKEPKRMWRRYLIGNTKFIWAVVKEKINDKTNHQQKQKKSTTFPANLRIVASNRTAPFQNLYAQNHIAHSNGSSQNLNFKDELPDTEFPEQTEIKRVRIKQNYMKIASPS